MHQTVHTCILNITRESIGAKTSDMCGAMRGRWGGCNLPQIHETIKNAIFPSYFSTFFPLECCSFNYLILVCPLLQWNNGTWLESQCHILLISALNIHITVGLNYIFFCLYSEIFLRIFPTFWWKPGYRHTSKGRKRVRGRDLGKGRKRFRVCVWD